jgi:hypothetical protein
VLEKFGEVCDLKRFCYAILLAMERLVVPELRAFEGPFSGQNMPCHANLVMTARLDTDRSWDTAFSKSLVVLHMCYVCSKPRDMWWDVHSALSLAFANTLTPACMCRQRLISLSGCQLLHLTSTHARYLKHVVGRSGSGLKVQ